MIFTNNIDLRISLSHLVAAVFGSEYAGIQLPQLNEVYASLYKSTKGSKKEDGRGTIGGYNAAAAERQRTKRSGNSGRTKTKRRRLKTRGGSRASRAGEPTADGLAAGVSTGAPR